MKTKILIVDDHYIIRAGVRSIIGTSGNYDVVGEAVNGNDAILKVRETQPDIVIMDISMRGMTGIEATQKILSTNKDIKIMALSMHGDEQFVKEMLEAGAVGYLLKEEIPEELLKAIGKVVKGEMFLSSGVTKMALGRSEYLTGLTVLQTKLQRTFVLDNYVIRGKIIEELENGVAKPLSIISAGAGFGKSIAVSQWLEQTNYLHTWISLDKEHNDFRLFLIYFCAAINKTFPEALLETNNLLKSAILPSAKVLLKYLLNEICDISQDFIIVLDDYHLITERKIHEFIEDWLKYPPANVHLSIITRRDPPIKMDTLRLKDMITEIRTDKLCFNDDETITLYKKLLDFDLNDQNLKLIQEKTEGWIIGLKLISMIIKDQEDVASIFKEFDKSLSSISDYLMLEMLSKQSEQFLDSLATASVLDRFCVDLLDEIWHTKNTENNEITRGDEIIQWLLRSNMFIIPLDTEQKWFRYHHLFHDLLKYKLKREKSVKQINETHKRACIWFERNNFIIEAIRHAIQANDVDLAISIIFKHWEEAFERNDWYIVDQWMKLLPEKEMLQSYDLSFVRIWIIQKEHNAFHLLPELIEMIEQREDELSNSEKGHLAFAKCMFNFYSGEGKKAIMYAERALQLIPKKQNTFRTGISAWRTVAMQISGQGDRALELIEESSLKIGTKDETDELVRYGLHSVLVSVLKTDINAVRNNLGVFFSTRKTNDYMLSWGWYFHENLSWWFNDMEGVVLNFKYWTAYRYVIRPTVDIDAFVCAALALHELNRSEKADQMINEVILFAKNTKNSVNISIAASGQARLNLLQGNIKAAKKWLRTAEHFPLSPFMWWWVEVPAITRCRVLIAKGTNRSLQEALELLREHLTYSKSLYNNLRSIEISVLLTLTNVKLKRMSAAENNLKYALELVANDQWIRPFVEGGEPIRDVLIRLKELQIKPDFVDDILNAINEREETTNVENINVKTTAKKRRDNLIMLTVREMEVLKYLNEGLENKEIAEKLCLSIATIKKHISNMFQKLQVKNRTRLTVKAREQGLL